MQASMTPSAVVGRTRYGAFHFSLGAIGPVCSKDYGWPSQVRERHDLVSESR